MKAKFGKDCYDQSDDDDGEEEGENSCDKDETRILLANISIKLK